MAGLGRTFTIYSSKYPSITINSPFLGMCIFLK